MAIAGVKSVESRTIRSFRVYLDKELTNGYDFCELIVDEKNHHFTANVYGRTFTYGWGSLTEDFIEHLIKEFGEHYDYLYYKMQNHSYSDFIDTEKTAQNLKVIALKARRSFKLDKDEMYELWEEIESFAAEDNVTESHFYDLYYDYFKIAIEKDLITKTPWEEEFIERKEDVDCKIFCQKVMPILAEVLKQEYGKELTATTK